MLLRSWHVKARILHAQWLKNLRAQVFTKCLPREHLHEPRAHIGRNGVPPKRARLIGEGQRCDLLTKRG